MATARPRPQVMRLSEAAADAHQGIDGEGGSPDRGRARRRQERRLRRHGIHHGIRRKIGPTDEVVEDKGVKLLIDPKAVLFLLGTEMDWKIGKLSSQFVFNNPEPDLGLRLRRVRAADAGEGRGRRGGAEAH